MIKRFKLKNIILICLSLVLLTSCGTASKKHVRTEEDIKFCYGYAEDFNFTLLDCKFVNAISNTRVAPDGFKYSCVLLEIENKTDEVRKLYSIFFSQYVDNVQYLGSSEAIVDYIDWSVYNPIGASYNEDVAARRKIIGWIPFLIPEDAEEIELTYRDDVIMKILPEKYKDNSDATCFN